MGEGTGETDGSFRERITDKEETVGRQSVDIEVATRTGRSGEEHDHPKRQEEGIADEEAAGA